MEIAFITSGYLPVPPTKGGAVENIIMNLIKINEEQKEHNFVVYTIFDNINEKFSNTKIIGIKVPFFIKIIDLLTYFICKNLLRKKHLITYRFIFQRLYFLRKVGKKINKSKHDKIVLENNVIMFKAFHFKNNFDLYKGKIYYHAHNEIGRSLGFEKDFKYCKKIISVSKYIENCFKKIIDNSEVKYTTLINTVDSNIFMKNASNDDILKLRTKYEINNGLYTIVFAGRISKEKGVLELLNALKDLSFKYNLLIIGNSFYKTDLKDKYQKKLINVIRELEGNIIFTGYIPYCDMYKYYQLGDICVLPSIWNDPCPLTVIECIMSGTPLITTNVGGIPEIVRDCTYMLDVNNISSNITNLLEECIINRDTIKQDAKKYRETYDSLFGYYYKFIDSLID